MRHFDRLRWAILVSLKSQVLTDGVCWGPIDIVYLRYFQEVIDGKSTTTHHVVDLREELVLGYISAIKFKIKLVVVVLFDVFDVLNTAEAQMVDLVGKVESVSGHVKFLHDFRVVVAWNVKVAWNFVDENKAT